MALTPDKIRVEHGLKINEKIIPWGTKWIKNSGGFEKGEQYKADRKLSNGTGKVQGVTIHNTGGDASAATYTLATFNQNMNDARVHYFVDDVEAWQNLREDEVGWHAGSSKNPAGNETTIGIEIVMHGKAIKDDKKAEDNGALLAAILLDKYKLTTKQLYTHHYWYNPKYCPAYILPHWDEFVANVQRHLDEIQKPVVIPVTTPKTPVNTYKALQTINIRKSATAWSTLLGKIPKGTQFSITKSIKNGSITWGLASINGKIGYIPISSQYAEIVKQVTQPTAETYKSLTVINMRANASPQTTLLAKINKGTVFTVTKSIKVGSVTWGYTTIKGKTGYVPINSPYSVKVDTNL